jgi:glycosyltransferase involved in cell wall biosynthesis
MSTDWASRTSGSSSRETTIVVMYQRLGPYHVARLTRANEFLRQQGARLVVFETAAQEGVYEWDEIRVPVPFDRKTLFPGEHYGAVNRRRLRETTAARLGTVEPDVVVVCGWSPPEGLAALAWCRERGRAAVFLSDTKFDDSPRKWWREAVKRRIVLLGDAALVAGSASREYIVSLGMGKGRVFEGCDVVDNVFFAEGAAAVRGAGGLGRRAPGVPDGPCFMASNRFIPRKNLARLVEAYARYRGVVGGEAWGLVLLGDGPERPVLDAQIAESVPGGVLFPGFRQIDELPAYYALAACFVHPALQDQWGLVVNEAMACGLPVLVSRAAGCAADLVAEGENGWTFDPTSVDEMAAALVRMHRLPHADRQAMGERGRKIIGDWGLDRYARGLWHAAQAALEHASGRKPGLSWIGRLLLKR